MIESYILLDTKKEEDLLNQHNLRMRSVKLNYLPSLITNTQNYKDGKKLKQDSHKNSNLPVLRQFWWRQISWQISSKRRSCSRKSASWTVVYQETFQAVELLPRFSCSPFAVNIADVGEIYLLWFTFIPLSMKLKC